jgi:hypothetical protein
MLTVLPVHIGLVSETKSLTTRELTRTAGALQKQVARDFAPIWRVNATISAYAALDDVPSGYWPVIVMDNIHTAGAAGVHSDKNGQPYALVEYSPSWSLTASHETLEMLADPFGNRLVAGRSPKPGQGRVEFLVEVGDPCEDASFAYTANGITVSDFLTPAFYDPVVSPTERYSFTGAIKQPRQVLKGGYLSWRDPVSDHWWQQVWFSARPKFRDLGVLGELKGSLRSTIDAMTPVPALQAGLKASDPRLAAFQIQTKDVDASASSRAAQLRAEIRALIGKK